MCVAIRLFGPVSVTMGAHTIEVAGRCADLLAYLALGRGRAVARSDLLEHVWADRGDDTRMGSFNTALWRLRQRLRRAGDIVHCDGRTLSFNPALQVQVDLMTFESALAAAHAPDLSTAQRRMRLRDAIALRGEDLLTGMGQDWALRERERYRRNWLDALGWLMALSAEAGEHGQVIECGLAILAREPLREDVHRALMRAYVAAGQRATALLQFETCRALLRRELAIQPMPETIAMYQHIAEAAVCRVADMVPLPVATTLAIDVAPQTQLSTCVALARQHLDSADMQLRQVLAISCR